MTNPRILIVDDNIDFGYSLGEILKDEQYEVQCANTGEEALEVFARESFDLVLLDMKLPRITGIEVFFEMRRIRPDVKVLMMSGHSVIDLLSQAVNGGMHRIFYPPYQLDSLRAVVDGMHGTGLVLVADNAPGLVEEIRQAMSEGGLSVLVAEDRKTALEQVSADTCDLLILDLPGPVIGGLHIYWELKQAAKAVPTIIVVPPPDGDFTTIEKLNQFSASGYFVKPFNPLDLLPAIAATIA